MSVKSNEARGKRLTYPVECKSCDWKGRRVSGGGTCLTCGGRVDIVYGDYPTQRERLQRKLEKDR